MTKIKFDKSLEMWYHYSRKEWCKMTNKEIKNNIRDIEERRSGVHKLCDIQISVVNLRKNKNSYVVDIIYSELDEGSYRYNNCKYSKELVERTS